MLNRLTARFSLPLLMKELFEQSAKRRLFVVRVLYAMLLYVLAIIFITPMVSGPQFTPLNSLGLGRELYIGLVTLQFLGIYLFLPAISCGVISIEKERNTLALLFLTRLSNRTIILEKLASRLVVMVNLLLTSLPLLAFCYALGGIETVTLISGVWFLGLSTLLVASVSILASSFFRSTVAAFLCTYFVLFVISFGPVIFDELLAGHELSRSFQKIGQQPPLSWLFDNDLDEYVVTIGLPPALFMILNDTSPSPGRFWIVPVAMLLLSIPTLCLVAINIRLAQACLFSRAFLPSWNPLLHVFKQLDRAFHSANERFTSGVILVQEANTIPDDQPVAWRETTKRSLGQFRYLVRILVLLEFPTLFFVLQSTSPSGPNSTSSELVSVVLLLLWMIVALLITTTAANLVTGERSRQTLEVLLTSPMSSRDIILEKMSGVRRLMAVCAIPLLTCVIFQTWWRWQLEGRYPGMTHTKYILEETHGYRTQLFLWHEYLTSGVLTVLIYLPFMAWLSLWMGIRTKSPARAILTALATLVGWCIIPMLLTVAILQAVWPSPSALQKSDLEWLMMLFQSSPAAIIFITEVEGLHTLHPAPYVALLVNSVIYGTCWFLIRRRVLNRADEYLGRGEAGKSLPEPTAAVVPALEPVIS